MTATSSTAHLFSFRGRSGRREFWWMQLVAAFAVGIPAAIVRITDGSEIGWVIVLALAVPILVLPYTAMTWRRLQDAGLPSWWLFLTWLPLVGTAAIIFIGTRPSAGAAREEPEQVAAASPVPAATAGPVTAPAERSPRGVASGWWRLAVVWVAVSVICGGFLGHALWEESRWRASAAKVVAVVEEERAGYPLLELDQAKCDQTVGKLLGFARPARLDRRCEQYDRYVGFTEAADATLRGIGEGGKEAQAHTSVVVRWILIVQGVMLSLAALAWVGRGFLPGQNSGAPELAGRELS